MKPYADSNFLVRLYLELPETPVADRWVASPRARDSAPLPLTWLHRLEVANAFQLHAFMSRSGGRPRITPELAISAHVAFQHDAGEGDWLDRVTMDSTSVERQAEELLLRHTASYGFRAYDLIHVAQALALKCDTFLSFDQKANKLARLEGLKLLKQ